MSSHHIVRDEQEPALLIWQEQQIAFEQAGELLEWSPRVVVHEQALEEILQWGTKLDAVWTSAENLASTTALLAYQQPVEILILPGENALAAVVQWLKSKKQSSIHLLANAQAHDYLLLSQLEALQKLVQVQVISQGWRYSYYSKSAAQKWLPEQSRLRVVSFGQSPAVNGVPLDKPIDRAPLQEYTLTEAGSVQLIGSVPFWLGEMI